jgi:hypothetical protein
MVLWRLFRCLPGAGIQVIFTVATETSGSLLAAIVMDV